MARPHRRGGRLARGAFPALVGEKRGQECPLYCFPGIFASAVLLPELVGLSSKILPRRRAKAYLSIMTKLLEQAVDAVRGLPPEIQDELARMLLQLAGEDLPVLQLSAEEVASFDESLAQADRGEFATDEQVRAIWAKHGL